MLGNGKNEETLSYKDCTYQGERDNWFEIGNSKLVPQKSAELSVSVNGGIRVQYLCVGKAEVNQRGVEQIKAFMAG